MIFKGYDWAELMDCFGLEYVDDDDIDNKNNLSKLGSFLDQLTNNLLGKQSKEAKAQVEQARDFVGALWKESMKYSHSHPLWKGLLDIEDDFTFMQYFITLLPHAWT